MRQLTARQKSLINAELKKYPTIQTAHSLPIELIDKLEEINDTEILIQEINRHIWDWQAKRNKD